MPTSSEFRNILDLPYVFLFSYFLFMNKIQRTLNSYGCGPFERILEYLDPVSTLSVLYSSKGLHGTTKDFMTRQYNFKRILSRCGLDGDDTIGLFQKLLLDGDLIIGGSLLLEILLRDCRVLGTLTLFVSQTAYLELLTHMVNVCGFVSSECVMTNGLTDESIYVYFGLRRETTSVRVLVAEVCPMATVLHQSNSEYLLALINHRNNAEHICSSSRSTYSVHLLYLRSYLFVP
jgi:hypothetical protein